MRIEAVRERLSSLPSPLPAAPPSLDPAVLAQPQSLPAWVRQDHSIPPMRAAALVLIYPSSDGESFLVLTERPTGALRHSGQISLPGGAEDPTDDYPVGTAMREAAEEVGLDPLAAGVETLAVLETVDVRVSGFLLVPVVALAEREPVLTPDPREVAAVLRAPVSAFLPDAPIQIVEEDHDGYRLRYGAYPLGAHLVWGATARVLGQLGAVLARD